MSINGLTDLLHQKVGKIESDKMATIIYHCYFAFNDLWHNKFKHIVKNYISRLKGMEY